MSARLTRRDLLAAALAPVAGACSPNDGRAPPPSSPEARPVVQVVPGQRHTDGAGVRLSKTLGSRALPMLDPFLMLDEIKSGRREDYERGFPPHPHRGFETVTYMISGTLEHKDSVGNEGLLVGGSVQWMTAGKGIVHSEMPQPTDEPFWGLQLWVNLPRSLKMTVPRYQDIAPDRVPDVARRGARVRSIAGVFDGVAGPVEGIAVAPTMIDVALEAGATFQHELPREHAAFAYVLDGDGTFGPEARAVGRGALAVLGAGATFLARAGASGCRCLVLSAAPIGEPVARRGPFVMNTDEELDRAFEDYRAGRLTDG